MSATTETVMKKLRPLSSYVHFCNAKREEVYQSFPDLTSKEVMKMLGKLWKELTDEEKQPYKDMYENDKHVLQQTNIMVPVKAKKPKQPKETKETKETNEPKETKEKKKKLTKAELELKVTELESKVTELEFVIKDSEYDYITLQDKLEYEIKKLNEEITDYQAKISDLLPEVIELREEVKILNDLLKEKENPKK